MKQKKGFMILWFVLLLCLIVIGGCNQSQSNEAPLDEAKAAGKTVEDFMTDSRNLWPEMDGGIELTESEIKGRNTWVIWTGGNQRFWDYIARHGAGLVDLLKLVDNRHIQRDDRLARTGLINEPGYQAPTEPGNFGLWLDTPIEPSSNPPDVEIYGYPSGIVGLRLFENPNFDGAAERRWDPERFMTDEEYYKDPNLIRPYRVGMSCGFCHVSFHPLHPPEDPHNPEWANLSSNIGSQYFTPGGIFGYDMDEEDLLWQLFNVSRPGTVDTSLVATDGNNNPNTMNAVFNVGPRLEVSTHVTEWLSEEACKMPVLPPEVVIPLGFPPLPECPNRLVPHILANGEDSIGARGALERVYINIGEYSEEWLLDHNVMIGLKPQRPFPIDGAQQNSVYWQASSIKSLDVARFFIKATGPMHLRDAQWTDSNGNERSGSEFIDESLLDRGAQVFAHNCIFCHSSKQPTELGFWNEPTNYEKWSNDPEYLAWAENEVLDREEFREGNYLSTDQRYPITLIGTNANRALADNSRAGRVWANFSSETYKNQESVGEIQVRHPYNTDETWQFQMPRGGPGRYRPLSLISIWATAPFLHNNTVGDYPEPNNARRHDQEPDVSVEGRLAVFNDSIEKMLWPDRRDGLNSIYRTTVKSYAELPYVVLADIVKRQTGINLGLVLWGLPILLALIGIGLFYWGCHIRGRRPLKKWSRRLLIVLGPILLLLGIVALLFISYPLYTNGLRRDGLIVRAPMIPQGTPIDLLFNGLNSPPYPTEHPERSKLTLAILRDLFEVTYKDLPSLDHPDVPDLVPNLIKISKSPDYVLDRGHMFGTGLPDEDKEALIEFLKTF